MKTSLRRRRRARGEGEEGARVGAGAARGGAGSPLRGRHAPPREPHGGVARAHHAEDELELELLLLHELDALHDEVAEHADQDEVDRVAARRVALQVRLVGVGELGERHVERRLLPVCSSMIALSIAIWIGSWTSRHGVLQKTAPYSHARVSLNCTVYVGSSSVKLVAKWRPRGSTSAAGQLVVEVLALLEVRDVEAVNIGGRDLRDDLGDDLGDGRRRLRRRLVRVVDDREAARARVAPPPRLAQRHRRQPLGDAGAQLERRLVVALHVVLVLHRHDEKEEAEEEGDEDLQDRDQQVALLHVQVLLEQDEELQPEQLERVRPLSSKPAALRRRRRGANEGSSSCTWGRREVVAGRG